MTGEWDTRPPPIDARSPKRQRIGPLIRRILLVGLAAIAVCVAAAVGIVAWLATQYPEARDAARDFAQGASQQACVPEALRRVERCGKLGCAQAEAMFLGECLVAAEPAPDLCEGVPRNPAGNEAYEWSSARCRTVDAPSSYCFAVLGVLIGECLAQDAYRPPPREAPPAP